jgi:hypothetical protein
MPSGGEPYSQVEVALLMSKIVTSPSAAYEDLLRKRVFPNPMPGPDKKDLIRHQKILANDESLSFLLSVWKESPYVSDRELDRVGLKRTFPGTPLTVYGIATNLASSASELGKVVTRTRAIALAGEAYGLIERNDARSTSKPLVATKRLDDFVLEYTDVCRQLLCPLGLSLNPPGDSLPEQ